MKVSVWCLPLPLSALIAVLLFAENVSALPSDCTHTVGGGTLSFTDVQSLLDSPTNPSKVKLCFRPNTLVLNGAVSNSGALRISKPDYSFVADPNTNVIVRNQRSAGVFDGSGIVVFQADRFQLLNVDIETVGAYGAAVYFYDCAPAVVDNVKIHTLGSTGLTISGPYNVPLPKTQLVRNLQVRNTGSYGVQIGRVEVESIENISASGATGWSMALTDARIKKVQAVSLKGKNGYYLYNSTIDEITDSSVEATSIYNLYASNSRIGLINRFMGTGSASFPLFFANNISLGGLRKAVLQSTKTNAQIYFYGGGRVGFIDRTSLNGSCSKFYFSGVKPEEPVGCS